MDYQAEYGLSEDDIKFIDENIQEANNIFAEISKKTNTIKENCESTAIEEYLNSL
ncbi:hypothetical protein [bacterium endosymbiont of Bathymodiolus sp. 5 South]|jgi:5-bromo-4-chloroindolyl phosphate hydrolysis protein|uniref:hypothetical protein n=1 Tax=bacterium endosymbiont of Bathymodiolus sp. 5 South TaxID=1181670 RepID=UPI0010B8F665|nr:hypothetical protein [bacterium endosymbiont of Bathymodiolus sp. 5 South]CAC9443350.1 hypothetical protein [uncultured Gammaproteobacteria bacterium]SSC07355.1 hypothetical protein BTURTLESOX_798 [bacterium endosymbiont of Bathymodiolus sp. 5 South]VVH64091.1 hypothetical protein BSPWISOX_2584 [uncultured Gammaproteobacteria bacterium]VVH65916.1 hypothetical protein BSPLISOX_309 [uncultured Gammaproteobacteria bacterium]